MHRFPHLPLCVTIPSLPLSGKSYTFMEPSMSWSQTRVAGDLSDQMTVLVGGAVRLLCGEAGVFVVSNEAFDPQSSEEYTVYRLNEVTLPTFFASIAGGKQPNSVHL